MPASFSRYTKTLMGMPVTVCIVGRAIPKRMFDDVYELFGEVDARYSTYKTASEISRVNDGLPKDEWSAELQDVMKRCEDTKQATHGYFDAWHNGRLDPSGLVKGWAIDRAAQLLAGRGYNNFYIDAGGDVQTCGHNVDNEPWRVGIRNPFKRDEIVKVLRVQGEGVATSGSYIRGDHIYNPLAPGRPPQGIASLTVVGPTIYDADRFATAAYAMGLPGIRFIESLGGVEGYMIDTSGRATLTSNFERYVDHVKSH